MLNQSCKSCWYHSFLVTICVVHLLIHMYSPWLFLFFFSSHCYIVLDISYTPSSLFQDQKQWKVVQCNMLRPTYVSHNKTSRLSAAQCAWVQYHSSWLHHFSCLPYNFFTNLCLFVHHIQPVTLTFISWPTHLFNPISPNPSITQNAISAHQHQPKTDFAAPYECCSIFCHLVASKCFSWIW